MNTAIDLDEILDEIREELYLMKPTLSRELEAPDHFKNKWGLDSLELVEYIARLEHRFHVLIPDQDLEKCISLNETALYLKGRLTSGT